MSIKSTLKKIYWKLPINKDLKQKISDKRFERMIRLEEISDKKGEFNITSDKNSLVSFTKYSMSLNGRKSEYYCGFQKHDALKNETTIVAYYLTQFHPNKQNDEWWGKGVTEWNNVNKAVPQFTGHYQPRRPGELGYYDLRIKENMKRQIELAKNYGVGAFCFYYYWFADDRLLELPLNMFLENKDLDIPFFYCWANENWTKRFSGTDEGILMGMDETEENYIRFINSILNDMKDDRYYRINNKPVITVYRPSKMPNPSKVLKEWRTIALKEGFDLYIIATQEKDTSINWCNFGFDAETEFQPKQIQHNCKEITNQVHPIRNDFSGIVYDYEDLVKNKKYLIKENMDKKVYHAVMPMWDNTARRNHRGTIFYKSSPELYEQWLKDIIKLTNDKKILDSHLVFINAWNEWGEGTYLEPDEEFGYAYLEVTHNAQKK